MTLFLRKPVNSDVLKCFAAAELTDEPVKVSWFAGKDPALSYRGVAQVLEFSRVVYAQKEGPLLWNADAIVWFLLKGETDGQFGLKEWLSNDVDAAKLSPVDTNAFKQIAEQSPKLRRWLELSSRSDFAKKVEEHAAGTATAFRQKETTVKSEKSKVAEKKGKANQKHDGRATSSAKSGGPLKDGSLVESSAAGADEDSVVVDAAEVEAAVAAWKRGPTGLRRPFAPVHPVLPCEDGSVRNVLVTSALPYVNNVPHLGNIVGCVLSADVFARYSRQRGYRTLYVCGTDEYGTATETKALELGLTPKEVCDKFNAIHRNVYTWFGIEFDHFGRTTTAEQTEIAQNIFWDLHANGYLLEDSMEQLHCEKCDRFLADRFVEGTCPKCGYEDARGDQCDKCGQLVNAVELIQPRCKICRSPPKVRSSQHLFLDLPKLEEKLSQWMDGVCDDWTSNAKIISKSWVKDGLKPRCITRDLKWGTPVPMEKYNDKVFYVWYDAPIGYPSITKCYTPDWEKWWKNPRDVELFMFMGKDNVPFHAVIFPSCLLGTGRDWTLVNRLCATEYLNYEDGKFSKSRGQGVFGDEAAGLGLPADLWRFYLLAVRPESQDSAFNWVDLQTRANSELLNNLGNFINRVLSFLEKNFEGVVPAVTLEGGVVGKENGVVAARVQKLLTRYVDLFERVKLRDALRVVMAVSRIGNQHMQASQPWVLVKGDEKEKAEAGSLIGFCTNIVCLLGAMLRPFMPSTSKEIFVQLNASDDLAGLDGRFTCFVEPGHRIGKPSPLFQKIESSTIEDFKKRFAGAPASPGGGDAAAGKKPHPAAAKNRAAAATSAPAPVAADPALAARLTEDVARQGDVVRELKARKADKPLVDAEVKKLLDLKRRLAEAQGSADGPSEAERKGRGGKKKGANK